MSTLDTASPTSPGIGRPPTMRRPWYGWALHDGAVVAKRNLLQIPRVPELLFFSLVQPVIFVLLFAYVFGGAIPESLSILPPFYCDYGLGATFGEKVFINQGCFFLDFGGITIGDRTMIGPRVPLSTSGHPVELAERYSFLTAAPIVIEEDVWIGASVTVTPGVTIGRGSVIAAGTVVSQNVPPMSLVSGTSQIHRRSLQE